MLYAGTRDEYATQNQPFAGIGTLPSVDFLQSGRSMFEITGHWSAKRRKTFKRSLQAV